MLWSDWFELVSRLPVHVAAAVWAGASQWLWSALWKDSRSPGCTDTKKMYMIATGWTTTSENITNECMVLCYLTCLTEYSFSFISVTLCWCWLDKILAWAKSESSSHTCWVKPSLSSCALFNCNSRHLSFWCSSAFSYIHTKRSSHNSVLSSSIGMLW